MAENEKTGHREEEKRRAKRVTRHFVARFREVLYHPSDKWDEVTVQDISKTGVAFYAARPYALSTDLELNIFNPLLCKENKCWGKVVRCEESKRMKGFYRVAVSFVKIKEPEEDFYKSIEYFIKKEEHQKEV